MMSKILSSRTVWVLIAFVLYNGVQSVHNILPASWNLYVDVVLGLAGTWFRAHPVQTFN